MGELKAKEYQSFESIKRVDENGNEYWFARELAPVLEYAKWENFGKVIDRAMLACRNSGATVKDQFPDVRKLIEHGKGGMREVIDYRLSRYACYLIVQNGDPRKEVIALGQTYFAIQTLRQEVADYFNQLDEDNKRLVIRGDIKQWNQILAETARNAGVITDEEFASFQNAGYMGLYGGETVADIHKRKALKPTEKILDFMNSSELIANLFRVSQAEEKIKKEQLCEAHKAADAHFEVGKRVREAIEDIGGTLPENQPTPKSSITQIEREQLNRMKASKNKMLDE
ncbi:MAG: DNA damage-inducible protein D [Firmicutes bacterium]|nr:DNA damage-inducible protein D [Bacillota bacterium]